MIDHGAREVNRTGAPVRLTARGLVLLWFLAGNPRMVCAQAGHHLRTPLTSRQAKAVARAADDRLHARLLATA